MADKTHVERIDRLKKVVQILAEGHMSLHKLLADLATQTRRGFDEVKDHFKDTDRRIRETDQRLLETGERVDNLFSAIGAFMSKY